MAVWDDFVMQLDHPRQRERMRDVLDWVASRFPQLLARIAWGQPMFTDHGTFIIGFSAARQHLAVAPESIAIDHFADAIAEAGYARTANLIQIRWDAPLDFALLEKIIAFNVADKAGCQGFWRK